MGPSTHYDPPRVGRRLRIARLAVIGLMLAMGLAGCGSGSSASQISHSASTWLKSQGYGDARIRQVQCMRLGKSTSGHESRSYIVLFTAPRCSRGYVNLAFDGTQVVGTKDPNFGWGKIIC